LATRKAINIYQYGNTVRFECTFFDFDGNKIDPNSVKIVIYDYRYNIVFNGEGLKNGVGEYFYDYTTEKKEQKLFYEWYGEIDGKPSLKRGEFMTKFI
jgi:hypothetical protein